jgi:hypothetical protein
MVVADFPMSGYIFMPNYLNMWLVTFYLSAGRDACSIFGTLSVRFRYKIFLTDGVYILAFGDVTSDGGLDDYSVTGNGDRNKILVTVASAVR